MEFNTFKLNEVFDSISIKHSFNKEELVFLNTSDILNGSVLNKDYTNVDSLPGQAKKSIQYNDILYSEIRPGNKRYALVDFDATDYVVSTKLMVLRLKKNIVNKVDLLFVYQVITSNKFIKELQAIAEGRSGTFPQITFKEFGSIEINIPEIKHQRKISQIVSIIHQKETVNKELISNLEELAKYLFQHWFIDFEFPNEEGKPYKSSGGEMVESELGEIPRDWQYLKLGELDCTISDHVANGSFKSLKDNVVFTELIDERYALFARNIDLKKKLSGDLKYITKDSYDFLKKSHLFGGEIIVSNVGDVGTIHRCPTLNIPMVLGNNQIYITSKKEFFNEYLYLLLKSNVGKSLISSITSGSVQMKFNKTDFRNSKIILPSDDLLKRIFSKIKIDLDLIEVLNNENKYLQHLRDTLLPKLLSGEIEIPDDLEV